MPTNTTPTDRIQVKVTTDISTGVREALDGLRKHPGLYQRAGKLVTIRHEPEDIRDACGAMVVKGTPSATVLSSPTIREWLSEYVEFMRMDKQEKKLRLCMPPDPIVSAIANRPEFLGVRPLGGLIETPVVRPDGTILEVPGYDDETGYVFESKLEFPPIPAHPDQADAMRALRDLNEVWCDFPYVGESHRSVPVAALLTLLARPAIRGNVPLFAFEANIKGIGKTKQIDAISIIACGRYSPKIPFPESEEEMQKVLGAYALRNATIINFDNVAIDKKFTSGSLDQTLTCGGTKDVRILGQSEAPTLRWQAVIFTSGNNINIGGDTIRRAIKCRVESRSPDPEKRNGFKHPQLEEWVTAERPRLVAAALTLIKAWFMAGKPQPAKPLDGWGSFEVWASTIPAMIIWAGGANPLECRINASVEDEETRGLQSLMPWWKRYCESIGKDGLTTKDVISALYSDGAKGDQEYEAAKDALDSLLHVPPKCVPSSAKFGLYLRSVNGRPVDVNGVTMAITPTTARVSPQRWLVRPL